jgi:hypothetical protein
VVDKDGKKAVVFTPGPTLYAPADYDQILSAYGLTIKDTAKVPSSYGKVVDKDGKKEVVFAPGPVQYWPKDFHDILSAYGF